MAPSWLRQFAPTILEVPAESKRIGYLRPGGWVFRLSAEVSDDVATPTNCALAQALAFLRRNLGRFPFERLVSHVFPPARITDAFREADRRGRGDGLRLSRAACRWPADPMDLGAARRLT